jgi:hypothetical protein
MTGFDWPQIPEGDQPERRALRDPLTGLWSPGLSSDAKSWHAGCMVTQRRAIAVSLQLFREDATNGSDCRAEIGREGEPCRSCAAANERWADRVRSVRLAMIKAFD